MFNSNYFFKQYKELKLNLEAAKASLKTYEKKRKILMYDGPKDVKAYDPSAERTNITKPPLIDQYQEIWELSNLIIHTTNYIEELENQLKWLGEQVEDMASKFDDLELKVFNLRHIKGMPLNRVAKVISYSYDYIREINANIIQKMT